MNGNELVCMQQKPADLVLNSPPKNRNSVPVFIIEEEHRCSALQSHWNPDIQSINQNVHL